MIKSIFAVFLCLVSVLAFACPNALPTNNPNFCASFKTSAICHCTASGLPSSLCQDMKLLYKRMISVFVSTDKACGYQRDTSKQECIDDWNCYLSGGQDSQGRACSATKRPCE